MRILAPSGNYTRFNPAKSFVFAANQSIFPPIGKCLILFNMHAYFIPIIEWYRKVETGAEVFMSAWSTKRVNETNAGHAKELFATLPFELP